MPQTYPSNKHIILKYLCTKYSKGLTRLRTKKHVYFVDTNTQIVPVAFNKSSVGESAFLYNKMFCARFGLRVGFGNFFSVVENKRQISALQVFLNSKIWVNQTKFRLVYFYELVKSGFTVLSAGRTAWLPLPQFRWRMRLYRRQHLFAVYSKFKVQRQFFIFRKWIIALFLKLLDKSPCVNMGTKKINNFFFWLLKEKIVSKCMHALKSWVNIRRYSWQRIKLFQTAWPFFTVNEDRYQPAIPTKCKAWTKRRVYTRWPWRSYVTIYSDDALPKWFRKNRKKKLRSRKSLSERSVELRVLADIEEEKRVQALEEHQAKLDAAAELLKNQRIAEEMYAAHQADKEAQKFADMLEYERDKLAGVPNPENRENF